MNARIKIIALVLVLELALLLSSGVLYWQEHETRESEFLNHISRSMHDHIQQETQELKTRYALRLVEFIQTKPQVIQAFIQRDREQLTAALPFTLDMLQRENRHFRGMAFILKDGTVFHHTSMPDKIGTNNRHVPFVRDSIERQAPQGGLVLSRGGLAYRFSHPVFDQQRYIGMIVLAVRPARALQLVTRSTETECGIFIDATHASHLDYQPRYTRLGKTLVSHSGDLFAQNRFLNLLPLTQQLAEFSYNGLTLKRFPAMEIKNYNGTPIGQIITVRNITEHRTNEYQRFFRTLAISSTILLITAIVLYFGIGFFLQQVTVMQQHLELRVQRRTAKLREANDKLTVEIAQHKQTQEELRQLSEKDVLTGVANRRKFRKIYETEWNAAKRDKRMISLLMLDIDCFKPYNDKYGHLAGDEALALIASTAKQYASRPRDLFARYGGEEFICLLPETSLDAAILVAEKMREKVEKLSIIHEFSEVSDVVTVSIGIASMIPDDYHSKEDFIDLSDKALYRAKSAGRNQTVAF